MSATKSGRSSETGWESRFFDDQSRGSRSNRPRIHDWMHFDIKNLAFYNHNNKGFENLNIDPIWLMADTQSRTSNRQQQVVDNKPFWVKNDGEARQTSPKKKFNSRMKHDEMGSKGQRNMPRGHVTRSSSKLSYDSTGPNDERYYVKSSPSQSSSNSNTRCPSESRKYFVPTKFGDHKEPTSLPVNLGVRLTSRSSPSLAITKEELEDELDERDFPHPDYSPEQIRRSDKNTHFKHHKRSPVSVDVWANSNRYKGSFENSLDDSKPTTKVHKIAEKIKILSEQDDKRRRNREAISFHGNHDPICQENFQNHHSKISEYDQFHIQPSKSEISTSQQKVIRTPLQSQPLPKIPTEYEDFRRLSSKNVNSDSNHFRNDNRARIGNNLFTTKYHFQPKESKTEKIQKNLSAAMDVLRKPQQTFIKVMENQRNRNLSTSDGNSRMSSARSSIESRPINEPEDTYSVILDDKPPPLPPPLPPPIPFASMPFDNNHTQRGDNYFHRRHGSDYGNPWQRVTSEKSSLYEESSMSRPSPTPHAPPGFDEVQAKQSHFFNSLFPSRANRFGFPVYPERQFGIPSSHGQPVSFAGFSPDLQNNFGLNLSHFPEDVSLSIITEETKFKKNKRKNLVNILKEWIDS